MSNDERMTQIGLLMEAAQSQQAFAENALQQLRALTGGFDGVVREEIRRTLLAELQALFAESRRTAQALHNMRRAANARVALWSTAITAASCLIATGAVAGSLHWLLPSQASIAKLRAEHAGLTQGIARLQRQGGRIELRRCGNGGRVCVRVDKKAPAYGENADYLVVKGY